jgi:hypothetical protein
MAVAKLGRVHPLGLELPGGKLRERAAQRLAIDGAVGPEEDAGGEAAESLRVVARLREGAIEGLDEALEVGKRRPAVDPQPGRPR